MPRSLMHVLAIGASLLIVPGRLLGQDGDTELAQIHAYLSARYSDSLPGAVVGIVRDGRLEFVEAYGLAEVETHTPMTVASRFDVMSVAKQFTAACVGLLVLRELIALDDPVRIYVPELPAYAGGVTIRHLLHHTSGIRDIHTLWTLAGGSPEDRRGRAAHLQMLSRQTALDFPPGETHSYSNSGYLLLALVVERVSNLSFPAFARQEIFTPLGMDDTEFLAPEPDEMSAGVASYRRTRDGRWVRLVNRDRRTGASDLVTTVPDLAKWVANWDHRRVGGGELAALLDTRGVLLNGDTTDYAWGNIIDRHERIREVLHSGGLLGIRCKISRFPSRALGLIFCGNGSPDLNADFYPIASTILVGAPLPEPTPAPVNLNEDRVEVDPARGNVARLSGRYASAELGREWVVQEEGGLLSIWVGDVLLGQAAFVVEEQGWRFTHPEVGTVRVKFGASESGTIDRLAVSTARVRSLVFERIR